MNRVFGEFEESTVDRETELLTLKFSPNSVPLKQRWRNNGLSADFMADYVTTFFPYTKDDIASQNRQNEIKSAVNYIANELLENAMKYSSEMKEYPIEIHLLLEKDKIVFYETNTASKKDIDAFVSYIENLEKKGATALYFERLEKMAVDGLEEGSGLGYATMINDYNAKLSWSFVEVNKDFTTVTTMVKFETNI